MDVAGSAKTKWFRPDPGSDLTHECCKSEGEEGEVKVGLREGEREEDGTCALSGRGMMWCACTPLKSSGHSKPARIGNRA